MSNLAGKRIFVVEDNVENRVITQLSLGMHGVQIEFDRWARDTVSKLHRFAPVDAIILDLMFPNNITGYEIYDLIRADRAFAHLPIVAVSASDATSAIPLCQAKGFAGFIAKPVDTDLFPTQIEQIINGHNVWYSHY